MLLGVYGWSACSCKLLLGKHKATSLVLIAWWTASLPVAILDRMQQRQAAAEAYPAGPVTGSHGNPEICVTARQQARTLFDTETAAGALGMATCDAVSAAWASAGSWPLLVHLPALLTLLLTP